MPERENTGLDYVAFKKYAQDDPAENAY